MRRALVIALLFVLASVLATGVAAAAPPDPAPDCVPVHGAAVTFTHTDTHLSVAIDGPDGAQTCERLTLAVYQYPPGVPLGAPFEQTFTQRLVAVSGPSSELVYFEVPIPTCSVLQADLATGEALPKIAGDHQYRDRLVDSDTFQTGGCPPPSTTTASTTTVLAPSSSVEATSTTVCEKGKTCELARTGTGTLWPYLAAAGALGVIGFVLAVAADRRGKRALR